VFFNLLVSVLVTIEHPWVIFNLLHRQSCPGILFFFLKRGRAQQGARECVCVRVFEGVSECVSG